MSHHLAAIHPWQTTDSNSTIDAYSIAKSCVPLWMQSSECICVRTLIMYTSFCCITLSVIAQSSLLPIAVNNVVSAERRHCPIDTIYWPELIRGAHLEENDTFNINFFIGNLQLYVRKLKDSAAPSSFPNIFNRRRFGLSISARRFPHRACHSQVSC